MLLLGLLVAFGRSKELVGSERQRWRNYYHFVKDSAGHICKTYAY